MIHWLLLLGFVFVLLTVIIVRSCVEHPSESDPKDNVHLTDRPRLNREELLQMRRDKLHRNLGETPKEE